jgi:ubiquinone/menaquinone biosynthesis C-methylase UbiE
MPDPLICDYEGSDYQSSFWDRGGREYEDRVEAIALKRLLPSGGHLLLELGAGAGRNTLRYTGFERIVLLDYSRAQLQQAQARLGASDKYIYVAADANRLPFVDGLFDAATMIRVLHHMVDAPMALGQVTRALGAGGVFILEFANKLNLKSILRYSTGCQDWSPFALAPVEFAPLNFDFHPRAVRDWLEDLGFKIERTLAVSHFRIAFLKRVVPVAVLATMDSLLQWTGELWQLTPSVFVRARLAGEVQESRTLPSNESGFFKCPECGHAELESKVDHLLCLNCHRRWAVAQGIYDFRNPLG